MDIFSATNQINEAEVRRQGIGFIDGTIPGYVLLLGSDSQIAGLVHGLTARQMGVFVAEASAIDVLDQAGISRG